MLALRVPNLLKFAAFLTGPDTRFSAGLGFGGPSVTLA